MTPYATLCLGTRRDAATWEAGCDGLGHRRGVSIRAPAPTADALASFFAGDAQWLYLGGHFGGTRLYNEAGTTAVSFGSDAVVVTTPAGERTLTKGREFMLHTSAFVVLWGGCSVCSGDATIRTLRSLFGQHVLLGFAGLTGWSMVDTMLGGGAMRNHFFKRLRDGGPQTMHAVAMAWMGAAAAWYGKGPNEAKFRAVDWEGQEWKLADGRIVEGRSFA